jgi:hypothetical protein
VLLEAAALPYQIHEAFPIARFVVQHAHAGADTVGDRREAEQQRERGVARDQRAVRSRHVHGQQRALEQLAIALVGR